MEALKEYYKGFYIDRSVGNNAFSFDERKHKEIYVPPLICGSLNDLEVAGNTIAFSEVLNGVEYNKNGLKRFLCLTQEGKNIFIFDNHNHAFFFWIYGIKIGMLKKGLPLVHVDQHSDLREPEVGFNFSREVPNILEEAFNYTNYVLNVGNFICPAMRLNLFSRIEKIDGTFAMQKVFNEEIVLDLDMDIFTEELNVDEYESRVRCIRGYITRSRFITVATSPYFIDQDRAVRIIKELFKG